MIRMLLGFALSSLLIPLARADALTEYAKPLECTEFWPHECRFEVYSPRFQLKKEHLNQTLTFYRNGVQAFSGKVKDLRDGPSGEPQLVKITGTWWLTKDDINKILRENTPLDLSPMTPQTSLPPQSANPQKDNEYRFLSLSNAWGEPMFSVLGRVGTPISPTSSAGVIFEYTGDRHFPIHAGFGSYVSPSNILLMEPTKTLNNITAGNSILLGKIGSQLALGYSFTYTHASISEVKDESGLLLQKDRSKHFLGVIPHLGLRFTSDHSYLLTVDIGKYLAIGPNLTHFIGDTPTNSTFMQRTNVMTTIGIGVGI